MNEILRDAYVDDNQRGVDRWNKVIREAGVDFELQLPNRRFNRKMGIYTGHSFDPAGQPDHRGGVRPAHVTSGCPATPTGPT